MNSNVHALELGRASKRIDVGRPDRVDVEAAFRTIIRWAGDDPERPGLIETPARVARSFDEFFAGYRQDPALILEKTFEEIVASALRATASITWRRSPARLG
jgi:GTP cyclohydrolase IA